VGMVLILIFAEVLGLYGCDGQPKAQSRYMSANSLHSLIVALILNTRSNG